MNMLRDPPTFKEVAKIFIVGITLRSYLADNASCSDEEQRTTCLGHEISRCISVAFCGLADRHLLARRSAATRRRIWQMSPERIKDYDVQNKKRAAERKLQLNQSVNQFAVKAAPASVRQ
ncbi:uncharacterized protein LOC111519645 [Drosophila willistoni]|uniref:uncharacterized protein LOC111519645 n=1 Tax=Drosophila willistoni TaxID=7260 RepID=UPI000C26D9BC|nr:uncharacterized protein LOC111519645 [Drosophila willistoni]